MLDSISDFLRSTPGLGYLVPALLLCGAAIAGRHALPVHSAWRAASWVTTATFVVALTSCVAAIADPGSGSTRIVQASVLTLVTTMGMALARFSSTYLAGERQQHAFVRWFLVTLAGSCLVVVTDSLLVIGAAWLLTSLSLQRLLVFYGDRPDARMAAHKKFLASRTADVSFVLGASLLWFAADTFSISGLVAVATDSGGLEVAGQLGIVLIALTVLLKSAQLPVHGWLMQVMEAPTPVSALLHAGVVNLGGFVLIRLAPLVDRVPVAQALLVIVGGVTAVVAALVMTTRISVKVHLAWSTCAQMGFMVLQCGLGLYEMALLHLLAHSFYKAHAFLSAGGAVYRSRVKAMAPKAGITGSRVASGALLSLAFTWLASVVLGVEIFRDPALLAMALIVALALQPLATASLGGSVRSLLAALAVVFAWFGWHEVFGHLFETDGSTSAASSTAARPPLLAWFSAALFVFLFLTQTWLASAKPSAFVQRMHARIHGGLFLDEWFTRLTLRLWPVRVEAER